MIELLSVFWFGKMAHFNLVEKQTVEGRCEMMRLWFSKGLEMDMANGLSMLCVRESRLLGFVLFCFFL